MVAWLTGIRTVDPSDRSKESPFWGTHIAYKVPSLRKQSPHPHPDSLTPWHKPVVPSWRPGWPPPVVLCRWPADLHQWFCQQPGRPPPVVPSLAAILQRASTFAAQSLLSLQFYLHLWKLTMLPPSHSILRAFPPCSLLLSFLIVNKHLTDLWSLYKKTRTADFSWSNASASIITAPLGRYMNHCNWIPHTLRGITIWPWQRWLYHEFKIGQVL